MGELVLPRGLALPAPPRIVVPDARLLIPASSRLLRRPLRRWRTAADVLTPAIALDAALGTGNGSGLTTSMTTTAAAASGSTIMMLVGRFSTAASTVSVTTAGGLTWTAAHNILSSNIRVYLFYAPAPSGLASSTSLGVTHSSGTVDCILGCVSYTGVDAAAGPTAFNGTAAASTGWSSGSVAGSAGNLLVGGSFVDSGSVSSSVPAGAENERFDRFIVGQAETLVFEDILSMSGATALTGTWNASATNVAVAASFAPSAGGGGRASKLLSSLGVG